MYKIIIALGFFITSLVNGQDSIVVEIKSNDYKPINGVLTINQKNKTFDHSNQKGETIILKKSPVDNWFVLDNGRNGYTLDFELYFRDIP